MWAANDPNAPVVPFCGYGERLFSQEQNPAWRSYAGQWRHGVPDGKGCGVRQGGDGRVYRGEWAGGRLHGVGVLFYPADATESQKRVDAATQRRRAVEVARERRRKAEEMLRKKNDEDEKRWKVRTR
jgi:hypothetical protein